MRDDQVFKMQEINVRRSMILLKQYEFCETRLKAMEDVMCEKWALLKALWNPKAFWQRVDRRQLQRISEAEEKFKKAMEKPVIKPVTVVGNG